MNTARATTEEAIVRTATAFLLAPPVGAILGLVCLGWGWGGMEGRQLFALLFALFCSWFLAIVGGLPLYLIFKKLGLISLGYSLAGGFFIAALPWFLLLFGSLGGSQAGEVTTTGSYTSKMIFWHIPELFVVVMGLCGALSGAVFWCIAARFLKKRNDRN